MATVAQLITYLQTLPQDLPVNVLQEVTRGYDTYARWRPLVLPTTENPHDSPNCNFDRISLDLGET